MADPADIGNDRAEQQLDDILAARQRPAAIVGSATCLHCGEAIQHAPELRLPQRWCDSQCRDDWERRNPERRSAAPREPVIVSGHVNQQIRKTGAHFAAHAEGSQFAHGIRALQRSAEADEAKIALRGHR